MSIEALKAAREALEREQFERWRNDYFGPLHTNVESHAMWTAWQARAALAAPVVEAAQTGRGQMAAPQDGMQFWLWKNGDHFLAFTHLYPCFTPGGDPMVLGEPVGRAVFKRSFDRAKQGVCEEGCDADRANERPFPTILHNGQRHELWLVTRDKQGTLKPYGATGPADLPSVWAAEYRAHLCSGARSAM